MVGIARHSQIEQIHDGLPRTLRRNRALLHQSPQDLHDLKIEELRTMERFVRGVNSVLDPLPR